MGVHRKQNVGSIQTSWASAVCLGLAIWLGVLVASPAFGLDIYRGNKFRKGDPAGNDPVPFTLTENTTVHGGNWILCRVDNVRDLVIRGTDFGNRGGAFDLTIVGGNVRGLYVNGTKLDSFTWQRLEAYPLADEILKAIKEAAGDDGVAAWLWTVQYVFDNPTTLNAQWAAAYDTWAAATTNMVDSARAFVRIRDRWFPGQSFVQVRDTLLAESYDIWAGEPIYVLEEVM